MALVPAMARDRKTARMQEQIKVLLGQGLSIRKVALALGISRQSVRKFGTAQPAEASVADAAPSEPSWDAAIDWQDVARQAAAGATIKQLHSELAPEASYTRFRRRLIAMAPRPIAAMLAGIRNRGYSVKFTGENRA